MSSFPPIPSEVFSVLGPIPVEQKDLLNDPVDPCLGKFRIGERLIFLDSSLSPASAWQTLWHEVVHVALCDAGIADKLHKAGLEENVCDALGTYLAAATRAENSKV